MKIVLDVGTGMGYEPLILLGEFWYKIELITPLVVAVPEYTYAHTGCTGFGFFGLTIGSEYLIPMPTYQAWISAQYN